MKLLDACLALALTLAVFASAATVLVEMLHRATQRRAKDLRNMLGMVFDNALAELLQGTTIECARLREEFIATVGTDSALTTLAGGKVGLIKPGAVRLTAATDVSIEDVLRRLSRSAVLNQALQQIDPVKLEQALRALIDIYARAAQASTALFVGRARILSSLCGVFLAVAVNVDAVRLLDYYIGNPNGTRQTIARLETMERNAEKASAALAPNTPGAAPAPTPHFAGDARGLIDDLQTLGTVGLPVGWSFYPYCAPADGQQIDARCASAAKPAAPIDGNAWAKLRHAGQFYFWLLCVLVTGLLIGLGSPYWFDIATSLSRFRELLRSSAGQSETAGKAPAPPPSSELDARIAAIVSQACAVGAAAAK